MVKLCGGIKTFREQTFSGCSSFAHLVTPSNALVITNTGGNHNFYYVADGIIPQTNFEQAVIHSECFNSMPSTEMSEVELAITGILGRFFGLDWNHKRERICELLAPYELQHKKEVTTILELALWKAKMAEFEGLDPGIREGCRVRCGAGVIIPGVLSFLPPCRAPSPP